MAGIDAEFEAGFDNVKVNTVLLRDVNDIHLDTFLAWIKPRPLQLRFIELMETGEGNSLFRERHVSGELIRQRLEQRGWQCQPRGRTDGPALVLRHEDYKGEIGLIMPYAKDFCARCNRLRVSSVGKLHLCLFGDGGIPLRDLLESDRTLEALKTRIARWIESQKADPFLTSEQYRHYPQPVLYRRLGLPGENVCRN